MNKRQLQEIAKFLSGIVTADIITIIWVASAGLFPLQAFGVTITPDLLFPAFIFDLSLLLVLIHYGWNMGKIPLIRERMYMLVAGVLFTIIAIAHMVRLLSQADVAIMGWQAPLWLSWVGVCVTAYLAYASFRFAARLK